MSKAIVETVGRGINVFAHSSLKPNERDEVLEEAERVCRSEAEKHNRYQFVFETGLLRDKLGVTRWGFSVRIENGGATIINAFATAVREHFQSE